MPSVPALLVRQPGGFRAFLPRPLPPRPALQYDDEMH